MYGGFLSHVVTTSYHENEKTWGCAGDETKRTQRIGCNMRDVIGCNMRYSLGYVKIAIEAMAIESSWIFPLKMLIFHSYVSLPEGIHMYSL